MTSELPLFSIIDINLIKVERGSRQRTEIETADLQASIAQLGLLQPPIVRRADYRLMAGERRWDACKTLGWPRIPVRWFESLDPLEAELVEFAENIKRRALPWQDEVRALARIYALRKEADPDLSMESFGELLGVTKGFVSKSLRVEKDLSEEKIAKAGSASEAYNILARRDQRAAGEAMEELLGLSEEPRPALPPASLPGVIDEAGTFLPETYAAAGKMTLPTGTSVMTTPALPTSPIKCLSFLEWLRDDAPGLTQKFNFVHCDFPYGLELFSSKQGRGAEPGEGYSDSAELYFQLLEAFCKHLDSFMSVSAHLMFWFSAKFRRETMDCFAKHCPSLVFYPYDLIWHKTDNAGIAGDYRRHPRHTYEQALLATRSSRNILGIVADSYGAPTDKRLHPSCKPEPMLRHFFQMFVDKESRVFDPTCGAGSSIRAAESLGAKQLLGLEIDPAMAEIAQREFRLRAKNGGQLC